jgi:hypothetical protein
MLDVGMIYRIARRKQLKQGVEIVIRIIAPPF